MNQSTYTVEVTNFSGPLDLLLQLIERRKLDVCDIALAQVTHDYLLYVKKSDLDLVQTNEFLEIASKLIAKKSHALLPDYSKDQDEPDVDITSQLRLLQAYRVAATQLRTATNYFVFRPKAKSTLPPESISNLTPDTISDAYKKVIMNTLRPPKKDFQFKRKSNQELKLSFLAKLKRQQSIAIHNLDSITTNRHEKISLFMLILELLATGQAQLKNNGVSPEIVMSA